MKQGDLISRSALLKEFKETLEFVGEPEVSGYAAEAVIEQAPAVDAVEVVHGRWEQLSGADYRCSICGFRFTSGDPIEMFEYCRCGAKMDGGKEDA